MASSSVSLSPASRLTQGGYIHFGDKTCTATFEVANLAADRILLKAFSARHCRFENVGDEKKISVSLYFDKTAQRSGGYVVNLPVEESFAQRASKALQGFADLNVNGAKFLMKEALQIPVHHDPWNGDVFSGSDSIVCNNIAVVPPIPDPSRSMSQSCWSFLDLGVFDLNLSKASVGEKNFKYISEQLSEKKKSFEEFIRVNPEIGSYRERYRKDVDAVIGLLRLQKYARLAYLLNMDLCKIAGTSSVDTRGLCNVQSKLIEIASQNLIEFDDKGRRINIFDKLSSIQPDNSFGYPGLALADLLAGRRLPVGDKPLTFNEADELARSFAGDLIHLFRDKSAVAIISMREALKKFSASASQSRISPALSVGTNFTAAGGLVGAQLQYGLFPLSAVSSLPEKIQLSPEKSSKFDIEKDVFGVSIHGSLRLAMAKDTEVVSFLPTDSGSMLLLNGVVPLMVLNTVNDAPTSGGASILALPEATEEMIPSAGTNGTTSVKNPKNSSGADQQVKISKNVSTAGACY